MTTSSLQSNGHCEELQAKHIEVSAGFSHTALVPFASGVFGSMFTCVMRESIGAVITTSLMRATRGRYFPYRACVHKHGVSRRCDKRMQPDDGPGYGQCAGCVRPFFSRRCVLSHVVVKIGMFPIVERPALTLTNVM